MVYQEELGWSKEGSIKSNGLCRDLQEGWLLGKTKMRGCLQSGMVNKDGWSIQRSMKRGGLHRDL